MTSEMGGKAGTGKLGLPAFRYSNNPFQFGADVVIVIMFRHCTRNSITPKIHTGQSEVLSRKVAEVSRTIERDAYV